MELLRFTTAGSVDDGKSTLIGRLLYDSKSIFEDQMEAVKKGIHQERQRDCRPLPAYRWLACRTGTGYHHRCGLPLFCHTQKKIYHCRYPGPRAVYPEHGYWCLYSQCCHYPDRCQERCYRTIIQAFLYCFPSSDPAHRGLREQNGPGGL